MHWLTKITQCSATRREFILITVSYAVLMLRTNYFAEEHRTCAKCGGVYLSKGTLY